MKKYATEYRSKSDKNINKKTAKNKIIDMFSTPSICYLLSTLLLQIQRMPTKKAMWMKN